MYHTIHYQNGCRLLLRHHTWASAERTVRQRGGMIAPMTQAEHDWYSPLQPSQLPLGSSQSGDIDDELVSPLEGVRV